jgi:hypothetical protein
MKNERIADTADEYEANLGEYDAGESASMNALANRIERGGNEVGPTLGELPKLIKDALKKSDLAKSNSAKAATKSKELLADAERYAIDAGCFLRDAKSFVKSTGMNWYSWVSENCGIEKARADTFIRIADGKTSVAVVRATNVANVAKHREGRSPGKTDLTPNDVRSAQGLPADPLPQYKSSGPNDDFPQRLAAAYLNGHTDGVASVPVDPRPAASADDVLHSPPIAGPTPREEFEAAYTRIGFDMVSMASIASKARPLDADCSDIEALVLIMSGFMKDYHDTLAKSWDAPPARSWSSALRTTMSQNTAAFWSTSTPSKLA